jgi:hypothetical protein
MAQAARRHDWSPLEDALESLGADERDFLEEAVIVLGEGLHRPRPGDPTTMFSVADAVVLRTGGFSLESRRQGEPDVVARTAARAAVMLFQAKTTAEVADALKVSATRIRQRAVERTLYAIRDGGEWRFPGWQFDPQAGQEIPGLAAVIPSFSPHLHPIAVYRFLTEPSPDLEIEDQAMSPISWLSTGGDPGPVADIAATL